MTQRERHTSDEGVPRQAARTPRAGRSVPANPPPTGSSPSDPSLWEEWFHRASPAQQQDALDRAVRDGILYAHQLAAPAAGAAPRRFLLSTLLNGPAKELEPLHPPSLDYHDRELDATQREAVARAVATPDVCLIQGFPGTGKSRILAEMILQAARRGERILFLAPTTAALDRVLERLGTCPAVCPLRCLGADESPGALPAAIARLTLPERLRAYKENTLPAARAARDAARRACTDRLAEQAVWTRLDPLVGRQEQLAERLRTLTKRRDALAAEVDALAAAPASAGTQAVQTFSARWDACLRARAAVEERVESELAVLRAELDTITGKQAQLENEWQQIRPLAQARQAWRIWTGAWWRALTQGGLAEKVRDLEARRMELQAAHQRLDQAIAARLAERAEAEDRCTAECRRLREEEIARRQAELDAEIALLSGEQEALREQWRITCDALAPACAPAEMSRPAFERGRAEWEKQREREERQAAAAEQWLRAVEEGLPTLPDKLAQWANVVAATTTALPRDALFGEGHQTLAGTFDLLILEEAHRVTEADFVTAARRARRWVLVGEPQADTEPPAAPRKIVKTPGLRPSFFHRLWENLHADPRRLPAAWIGREGRLVCRLRPLPAEQEQWIQTEPVADRPDIELRILSAPGQTPRIAEVVFPAYVTVAEAKQFIFRELDELAVQTHGRKLSWSETDEDIVLELAPDSDLNAVTVAHGDGVSERLSYLPPMNEPIPTGGPLASTSHLRFARAAGWTGERAEQWVAEHLGLRTLGRTVLLTVPYRLEPSLARFLSDLLFGGACEPARAAVNAPPLSAPVEFVAVPSVTTLEGRPRLRAVKGGAGLELDLANNRPLEELPAGLRALLPRQGLVNYLEAQAVVRRLAALAGDDAFRSACARWCQRRAWPCEHGSASTPAACDCPRPEGGPAVAVMALYPAQAELLRHLIRQTPALADSPFSIEVGTPAAFGQRECLLALVSLTRSHAHRAVSYGEHPNALAQALTRATAGVIVFGDPGTLARRSQWHGALDHLDEAAAQREGHLITQLVHYLQGHGPHPSVFHLQEGSGV